MAAFRPGEGVAALSVVIPAFNSARWLPSTLAALATAIVAAKAIAEVIVVDDGSTDGTAQIVEDAAASFPGDLRVLSQGNRGRFLARWEGITHARASRILLLDSRVIVHEQSIRHVLEHLESSPADAVWNAFVITDPTAPLVGLFWEVPTHVFWGSYLRSPRVFHLTSDNFDTAPKGTTMFLAPKNVLVEAFEVAWPEGSTKLVSDDTKVLRHIAASQSIRLDPQFSATYRPRASVGGFIRHTLDRGTLFVDSYAGTTVARSAILIVLALAPIALVSLLILLIAHGMPLTALIVALLAVALIILPAGIAARNGCRTRAILSYVSCLPIFLIPFWAGLVRGIVVHRRTFGANREDTQGPSGSGREQR